MLVYVLLIVGIGTVALLADIFREAANDPSLDAVRKNLRGRHIRD